MLINSGQPFWNWLAANCNQLYTQRLFPACWMENICHVGIRYFANRKTVLLMLTLHVFVFWQVWSPGFWPNVQKYTRDACSAGIRSIRDGCCGFALHHIRTGGSYLLTLRSSWGPGLMMHTKSGVWARYVFMIFFKTNTKKKQHFFFSKLSAKIQNPNFIEKGAVLSAPPLSRCLSVAQYL